MPCTERYGYGLALGLATTLLVGCASAPPPPPPAPRPAPVAPAAPAVQVPAQAPAPAPLHQDDKPQLKPPTPNATFDDLRRQVALRIVAANPDRTYMTAPPPVLLAIPVLEVELFVDGRIKKVNVLRRPGQAPETLQMAIDAIHRAAPFGDVSRLKAPHKFVETFLFNDERRFKPRTLDD